MRTFTIDLSNAFQPHVVISNVGTASLLAFIAFAAATFWQFSYRWLRVIAAFFALLLLPLVALLIIGRFGSYVLPIDWILRLPAILEIAVHSIQLGVAGVIYLWSIGRSGTVWWLSAPTSPRKQVADTANSKVRHCKPKANSVLFWRAR